MFRPHASLSKTLPYNAGELEKVCGPYYAGMLKSATGCCQLQDSQSIMRYDLPAALNRTGTDLLQGGCALDNEARDLIRSLYPSSPEPWLVRSSVRDLNGFRAGQNGTALGNWYFNIGQTSNIVTGLCRIDMGLNGNFRLRSNIRSVQHKAGYTWEVGTWDDTHLIDASYHVLSFEAEDQRVKTGRVEWIHLPGGNERSYRENFATPFNKTPNVVVFITGFDTIKGKYIRIDVSASNIDRTGFTVNLQTWAGKSLYSCLTHSLVSTLATHM